VTSFKPRYQWKGRRAERKGYRVIGGNGLPCPRCGQATQIREHVAITDKHLRQPYYFSRWFYCRNPQCPVTMHVTENFKVRRLST
jgi:hypothetical protein